MVRPYINKTEYFKDRNFPVNDEEVWKRKEYQSYLYLYDKFYLSQILGYHTGLINSLESIEKIDNNYFPLYIRPRVNLYGMGLNSFLATDKKDLIQKWTKIFNSREQVNQNMKQPLYQNSGCEEQINNDKYIDLIKKNLNINLGFFWTPYLLPDSDMDIKEHLSYDLVIVNGEVKFECIFLGQKKNDIEFHYWERVDQPSFKENKYILWILNNHLSNYSGIVNIEVLGNQIIEIHLRMGDMYHLKGMLSSIYQLYDNGVWNYQDSNEKIYLFPVFGSKKVAHILKQPGYQKRIDEIMESAIYYQFLDHYLDNFRLRIFFFKIDNFAKGLKIQRYLYELVNSLESFFLE